MKNNQITPTEKVIELLVEKFNDIDVQTHPTDWSHIKDYRVNMTFWERKFFHPSLGYMEVIEQDQELKFNVKILSVFRYATQSDDLELIKTLFNKLVTGTQNPNIQAYYEDSLYNLTNASRNGNMDVIKFLVENGVHIHVDGEANVIAALKNHKYEVVQYFLETDPKINLEVVLKDKSLEQNMVKFINNWQLYQVLNKEVDHKEKIETKLKI
jgi:hypothetical protein